MSENIDSIIHIQSKINSRVFRLSLPKQNCSLLSRHFYFWSSFFSGLLHNSVYWIYTSFWLVEWRNETIWLVLGKGRSIRFPAKYLALKKQQQISHFHFPVKRASQEEEKNSIDLKQPKHQAETLLWIKAFYKFLSNWFKLLNLLR